MKKWLFLGIALIFLTACKDESMTQSLINRSFEIAWLEINDEKIIPQDFGEDTPRINFETNAYNGTSGCNSFFGSFSANADALDFQGGGATKMLCPPLMKFEDALLSNLRGKFSISEDGTHFILSKNKAKIWLKK